MIKVDHPIRQWMRELPREYECKSDAFHAIKHFLAGYGWFMIIGAPLACSEGSLVNPITDNSGNNVGHIYLAWVTTFDGRVRFMAEIT